MDFGSKLTNFVEQTFLGGKPNQSLAADDRYSIAYRPDKFKRKVQVIQEDNWNKMFRYYFRIRLADAKTGEVISSRTPGYNTIPALENFIQRDANAKNIDTYTQYLEIPPQNITIQTHFASTAVATNRGVLEENNGTLFRTITIAGSTGVWPTKPFQGKRNPPVLGKLLQAVLPGAVTAIGSLIKNVQKTVASVIGGSQDASPGPKKDSGYYQFWALHNFFVAYAESKKDPGGNRLRLIFGSPKDNIEYVCTPVQFEMRKDSSSPLLYRYQIVLRAWDLTTDKISEPPVELNLPTPEDVNAITSVVNALRNVRSTIVGAQNVIKAVNSDFTNVMLVFNQASLVLKEVSGVGEDIGDFGTVFKNNANYLLKGPSNDFYASLQNFEKGTGTSSPQLTFTSVDESQPLHGSGADGSLIAGAGGSINTSQVTPGGEGTALSNARLNIAGGVLDSALQDPTFIQGLVSDFTIPPNVDSQLEDARIRAREITSGEVRDLANNLQQMSDNHAQSTGMMDADYASTFGIPFTVTERVPTEDDVITNAALQEAKMNLSSTLATGQIFRDRDLDPFAIANENLSLDDQMDSPNSAFPIPFPRGRSLEDIAQQYLGDSNRWREIVLLNALRAPFIDEDGFDLDIFSANGRTFVVKDISKLTISQRLLISANTVASTKRSILNIEDIGGSQWRITVDGQDNLSAYVPLSLPKIHTRFPGCVGSGDIILLPSTSISDDPITTRPNALYARLTHAEKVFKIDLALDPKNGRDFVVDHAGDVKRSYGYDNGAQAIRLVLETEQGELERHATFGVAVPIGSPNSNITVQEFEEIVASRVRSDPRFLDADVQASIEGSVARVNVVAHGAAGTGKVPVEFEIGKSE